jgi:diaminopimelate decarboxylase
MTSDRLDLGGGLGIPYERSNSAPPLPLEYGDVIRRTVGDLGVEVEIEPGRLISGNAGILVSGVIYVKKGDGRDFLILDAAMNDLIRPAMYGAWHDIVPVVEPAPGLSNRRLTTLSDPFVRPAIPLPNNGLCHLLRLATWSPSAPPGPMVR